MDMRTAKFNEKRFEKTDFAERFLDLVGRYHDLVGSNFSGAREATISDAKSWIDDNRDYCVRSFLTVSSIECQLPFSLYDVTKMTVKEFMAIRKRAEQLCAIYDEKKALLEEYLTFYDE